MSDIGKTKLLATISVTTSATKKTLSESLSNYRFVLMQLNCDGYIDSKMFPVETLDISGILSGRGYCLKSYSNDNYYIQANVGFYSTSEVEVKITKNAGWSNANIYIYGVI